MDVEILHMYMIMFRYEAQFSVPHYSNNAWNADHPKMDVVKTLHLGAMGIGHWTANYLCYESHE